MDFLGTFAGNDGPREVSFGVFHRPTIGWFAFIWTDEIGPFDTREDAERHLCCYNVDLGPGMYPSLQRFLRNVGIAILAMLGAWGIAATIALFIVRVVR